MHTSVHTDAFNFVSTMASIPQAWNSFLHFEQQQRGSEHWHALSFTNIDDAASDGEDRNECLWDWGSVSDDNDLPDEAWNSFLCFEQQQRGSTHWHAFFLRNDDDGSDGEDRNEWLWDWGSVSDNDDLHDDQYRTTSDNDSLVTVTYPADSLTTPVNYIVVIVIIIVQ